MIGDCESGVLTATISRTAQHFADKSYCAENLLNDRRVVFYKQLGNNGLRLQLKPLFCQASSFPNCLNWKLR